MKPRKNSFAPTRSDDANAFIPDTTGQARPLRSADAEYFAEEFIGSATGARSVSEDAADEVVDEEDGGPFIVLNEDAQLPSVPEERESGREGHDAIVQEDVRRGALWASRG